MEISFRTSTTCPAPKVGKDLWINYNPYNLPNSINNAADAYVTLTHTADGEKLTKVAGGTTRSYVAGIEYLGANLDAIYHAEGRCTPNGATLFHYEYTLKDHLGNARVNFRANGAAVTFLEEMHYYPFGMLIEGIGTAAVTQNGYKYNYKEINTDLGLNWSDYGARWYDPAVGRWAAVDPSGEKYKTWSPYNYGVNNPIRFIDVFGKYPGDVIVFFSGGIWNFNLKNTGTMGEIAKIVRYHTDALGGNVLDESSVLWYTNTRHHNILNYPPTQENLDDMTDYAFNYIIKNYNKDENGNPVETGKVVIAGFSYGGAASLHLARRLEAANIPVSLLITLDPAAGPRSEEVDRSIPKNVEKNINVYQESTENTAGSRGAPNKRRDGSERGIENIKVTVNHELVDDAFKYKVIAWIYEEINRK